MTFVTAEMIRDAPEGTVFVFGGNMAHVGHARQAKVARPFVESGKAFELPTKRTPWVYFSGKKDEWEAVQFAFVRIWEMAAKGKKIVFFPNIGNGLAKLYEKAPELLEYIQGRIRELVSTGRAMMA